MTAGDGQSLVVIVVVVLAFLLTLAQERRPRGQGPPTGSKERGQRVVPCAWCGDDATLVLRLAVGDQVRAQLPLCNADAASVTIGDWSLTIKCMDRVRTVRGTDLPEHDGHVY